MSKLQSLLNTIMPDDAETTTEESSLPDLGGADYVLNLGPQSERAPASWKKIPKRELPTRVCDWKWAPKFD